MFRSGEGQICKVWYGGSNPSLPSTLSALEKMSQKVMISRTTVGEFELKCSVLLLTEDEDDWIDSIYDLVGEDSFEYCEAWAVSNGYEIVAGLKG